MRLNLSNRSYRGWLRALPPTMRPSGPVEIAAMLRLFDMLLSDFGPQWPRPFKQRDNILGPMRCAWLRQIALAGFQRTEQQLQGWVHLHGIADYLLHDNWERPPAQPYIERGDFFGLLALVRQSR